MKKGHSKYWDVYWTLQEIVKCDEWTGLFFFFFFNYFCALKLLNVSIAPLVKERAEKFGGLEDRIENLQSRCADIKEFYIADGFAFFYQTPEKEPPPPEEIVEDVINQYRIFSTINYRCAVL